MDIKVEFELGFWGGGETPALEHSGLKFFHELTFLAIRSEDLEISFTVSTSLISLHTRHTTNSITCCSPLQENALKDSGLPDLINRTVTSSILLNKQILDIKCALILIQKPNTPPNIVCVYS